nr:hypothetical protein [Tanacetum cinerariifolium]
MGSGVVAGKMAEKGGKRGSMFGRESCLTVIALEPVVSTGIPSLITIDQDAPSPSTSQTTQETLPPVTSLGVKEADHDIKVAHKDNNPFVEFPIPEPGSKKSSTQVVIPNNVHSINQPPEHINKRTKDHPINNVIGDPSRLVFTRHQLQDEVLLYYFYAFLSFVEPNIFKDALMESCWIEAMQEELNEFDRFEVWKLVPHLDCVMIITLKWIYKQDKTLSRSLNSSSNTNRLAVTVSNMDNLGRDMKKLKENVHAIQVGYQICKGPHLDKECPLNEDVKQVEEAKYGEFGCLAPFNKNNRAKYRVGPPGYYTRIDNRPPYREKRPSLKELMNKHLEE